MFPACRFDDAHGRASRVSHGLRIGYISLTVCAIFERERVLVAARARRNAGRLAAKGSDWSRELPPRFADRWRVEREHAGHCRKSGRKPPSATVQSVRQAMLPKMFPLSRAKNRDSSTGLLELRIETTLRVVSILKGSLALVIYKALWVSVTRKLSRTRSNVARSLSK